MAFWGNSFVFNDIPCDDYDLMLYDVGSTAQGSGNFASGFQTRRNFTIKI